MGVYFGPQYEHARRTITKLIVLITVIDDLYDSCATYDKLVSFTDAVERCDISAMNLISPHMRPLYQVILDYFDEMEEELTKDGKAHYLHYAKIETNKWVRSYLKEAEWLRDDIIPKFDEYRRNASISISYQLILITSLIVAKELISNETFEWMINESLVAPATLLLSRLKDDIIEHEHEQQREHGASFIECYMKEYGASKQEAYGEAWRQIANAWKDINMEYLRATKVPTFVLKTCLRSFTSHNDSSSR